jgi:glycosyltransferase involved in cell wall biosynthesis
MRIAQIAPLYESCPPRLYGGTERVVSYLTEELIRQGHDVTLFAIGDSRTSAVLEAPCDQAIRLNPACQDSLPYHLIMLNRVAQQANSFDIIHFHTDYIHFPLFVGTPNKTLTTLHRRLDLPDLPSVVSGVDEAVAALSAALSLDRRAVRRRFEERFTVEKMTREYLRLYGEITRSTSGGELRTAA